MWINFKNLCKEEIADVLSGDEERTSFSVMSTNPNEIALIGTKFGKVNGWYVVFHTRHAHDPKLHFTDESKAQAFYNKLCDLIINPVDYIEIDALAEGAI